jgi:transcriptional regulator with XRE-family HTH domain
MLLNEYLRIDDMTTRKTHQSQQEFLRDAMNQLDMTRERFADRLNTSKRRLDNWLLPSTSAGFRELDPTIWQFIREILEFHAKEARQATQEALARKRL